MTVLDSPALQTRFHDALTNGNIKHKVSFHQGINGLMRQTDV